MALAIVRGTVAGFGKFAIWADASLGVHAPEEAVIARLHGFVVRGGDELALPAQRRTEMRMVDVEACFATMNHD
jgi:hypothetical protein